MPTQTYANRPARDRGDAPCEPQRLEQKPSTATSSAVSTTLMARLGEPREASFTRSFSLSRLPREQEESRTCAPMVSAGNRALEVE